MAKQIGIDLGTANTVVYVNGKGIIMRVPSVVALDKQTRTVLAVGEEAKKMLGKTPGSIVALRPLKDGVIADFEITAIMLNQFFRQIDAVSFFNRPTVVICIPFGATEVEKRAVENATYDAGAKHVALVEEPIAAAIGSGLRVSGAVGNMIVDIGGGTTEVAVISYGGIVVSRSIRVAGDEMDIAIVDYIRRKYQVLIGDSTAELLKTNIGSAHRSINRGAMRVFGRNLKTGLASELAISSDEIREAVAQPIEQLIGAIKGTLEDTPPELSADILDKGIVLAGGGALLAGIDRVISERTGIAVRVAKHPLDSVCLGIGHIIESQDEQKNILRYRNR